MLDNTSDYRSLICYALLLIILFLFKHKNYIVFTFSWSFISFSLGGGQVFGFPFSRFYLVLLYFVTFYFILTSKTKYFHSNKMSLFSKVLLLIILKIIMDTFVYGTNQFRVEILVIAFHVLFLSGYIFQTCFRLNGFEKTVKDFIVASVLIHGVISVILFVPLFQNQVIPALGLGHRITIFNQDTINSARPFYLFIIFLLSAFHLKLIKNKYLKIIVTVIGMTCFFIIFLNGSRQYVIALGILLVFPIIKFNVKTFLFAGVAIVMITPFLNFVNNKFADISVVERFSSDQIERENDEGRSAIWKKGFSEMLSENPILGLGFRNFGNKIINYSADNQNFTIKKDNAHGFFQEVFIEHGVILGILILISFIFSFFELRIKLSYNNSLLNSIITLLLGFIIPNFFTGYIMSSMGFYLLGLFLYNYPKLSLQK
jgi:hypothetical protein